MSPDDKILLQKEISYIMNQRNRCLDNIRMTCNFFKGTEIMFLLGQLVVVSKKVLCLPNLSLFL